MYNQTKLLNSGNNTHTHTHTLFTKLLNGYSMTQVEIYKNFYSSGGGGGGGSQ